jgi:hypothetical protein
MIARALILVALLAVPPLTENQRADLTAVHDDSPHLEEPALQVLLTNVLQWEAGDESGARIPDYDALLADPAAGRGESFLIEGKFAGRARRLKLKHDGEFGDALTEWVIVVRDDPQEVAVVYLIDPAGELESPQTGAEVRTVGRFYKVWADTDADGNPARYLTFVARSAKVVGVQTAASPSPMLPMLLLVAVLGVVYILVRRMGKHATARTHLYTPNTGPHAMLSGRKQPNLSDDPAEALRRMTDQTDEH